MINELFEIIKKIINYESIRIECCSNHKNNKFIIRN